MCSSHNHTHICLNLQLVIAATKKYMVGTCLAVQWLRICTSSQGAEVQSLVEELRSHMLCGVSKK